MLLLLLLLLLLLWSLLSTQRCTTRQPLTKLKHRTVLKHAPIVESIVVAHSHAETRAEQHEHGRLRFGERHRFAEAEARAGVEHREVGVEQRLIGERGAPLLQPPTRIEAIGIVAPILRIATHATTRFETTCLSHKSKWRRALQPTRQYDTRRLRRPTSARPTAIDWRRSPS
jgi:hypothetical protein